MAFFFHFKPNVFVVMERNNRSNLNFRYQNLSLLLPNTAIPEGFPPRFTRSQDSVHQLNQRLQQIAPLPQPLPSQPIKTIIVNGIQSYVEENKVSNPCKFLLNIFCRL